MSDEIHDMFEASEKENPQWLKIIIDKHKLHRDNGNPPEASQILDRTLRQQIERANEELEFSHGISHSRAQIIEMLIEAGAKNDDPRAERFLAGIRAHEGRFQR